MHSQTSRIRPSRSWPKVSGYTPLSPLRREDAVARPKSQEYLRFVNQVLHVRNDAPLNSIQNELKQMFYTEYDCVTENGSFLERYARSVASMHVHGSIRPHKVRASFNFCATVQHLSAFALESASPSNALTLLRAGSDDIQISVFIDVRQFGQKSQGITDGSVAIVRLNALNECKRLCGNVRKFPFEYLVRNRESMRDWGISCSGSRKEKRKQTILGPFRRKRLTAPVPLDKLECDVIKGGAHLVNHLSDQDTNFSGRSFRNIQLSFALRLDGDFVRLTSGINGDAALYGAEVFCSPDELKFRRFDSTDHRNREYRDGPWLVKYIIALITCVAEPNQPSWRPGDRARLRQVLGDPRACPRSCCG